MTDRSLLNVKDIYEFANVVKIEDVKDVLQRQIDYNLAIAKEGLENNWGANIGSVILKTYGDDIKFKAKAYAAAGSDARMSGCEMPVIINSGSGNQGMTASLPVIVYAREEQATQEQLYLSLIHIWYMDLRRFGGCKHAGFGLGFDRFLMYLTGMQNIRDVEPFPRTPRNLKF